MQGYDAFEKGQGCTIWKKEKDCGAVASDHFEHLIGKNFECELNGHDKYNRVLATCKTDTGKDIGALMVRSGLAFDYSKYSAGKYREDEAYAKKHKFGAWGHDFIKPWVYRRKK
tara:strand:+ start:191 stop:532 length:342 start_codon:yes stop_codon:yes gene_type:complete